MVSSTTRTRRARWWRFFLLSTGMLGACGNVQQEEQASACDVLARSRASYEGRCRGAPVDVPRASATCLALVTLPGARLTSAALDECRAALDAAAANCSLAQPECFGFGGVDWLHPEGARGALAAGEPCVASHQCADGFCTDDLGEENQYLGWVACKTCRAKAEIGEPCSATATVCKVPPGVFSQAACLEGTCTFSEGLALGETCLSFGGDPCRADFRCGSTPGTEDGACVVRIPIGSSCADDSKGCTIGAHCSDGTCVPGQSGTCAADDDCGGEPRHCVDGACLVRTSGEGESCGTCAAGLVCTGGTCRYPAYLGEGEACSGESACSPELMCDLPCEEAETCLAVCRRGGPGTAGWRGSYSCEGELTCDFDVTAPGRGTCVAPAQNPAGAPCPCAGSLACVAGTCTTLAAVCPLR